MDAYQWSERWDRVSNKKKKNAKCFYVKLDAEAQIAKINALYNMCAIWICPYVRSEWALCLFVLPLDVQQPSMN